MRKFRKLGDGGGIVRGTRRVGWLLPAATMVCLALSTQAAAVTPVDCNTPNDFCTGDPCITKDEIQVTVASCVLDFGTRALVLGQVVFLPNNGSLSLKAGSIEVRRRIDGRHIKATAGDGADISLTATGDILVRKRLDAAGRKSAGSIVLTAGGNIDLRDQLRARAKGHGATANGGNVTVHANGGITSAHKGKIDVRGRQNRTVAGQAVITGDASVGLQGKVDARGNPAGVVHIASAAGNVLLEDEVTAVGAPSSGGTVHIDALGDITTRQRIDASGGAPVVATIALNAGGSMNLSDLRADGHFGAPAGTVAATATSITAGTIRVRGASDGGLVFVASNGGNLNVDRVDARGKEGMGGSVTLNSSGDLKNTAGTKVDGDAAGGRAHFVASGDIVLGQSSSSRFDATATAGGTIEAHALGDLTAVGHFEADAGGCIALSAGGTSDTSAAEFDVAVTSSCP